MNRALFLDRDGVINMQPEGRYVNRPEDFVLAPGIQALVRSFRARGYLPIVVTNQAGVAHGFLTQQDLDSIHDKMLRLFKRSGASLCSIYECTEKDGPMRKPEPGMLLQAQRDWDIDMDNSILIGDQITDIQAGRVAGVGVNILIESGGVGKVLELLR